MDWPQDADGDVMRRLNAAGFDFNTPAQIDFHLDFDDWPPSEALFDAITRAFPDAAILPQDDYLLVQLVRRVSYELVTATQASLSALSREFGGRCDSWGVMH
jgi:hypothetical protein